MFKHKLDFTKPVCIQYFTRNSNHSNFFEDQLTYEADPALIREFFTHPIVYLFLDRVGELQSLCDDGKGNPQLTAFCSKEIALKFLSYIKGEPGFGPHRPFIEQVETFLWAQEKTGKLFIHFHELQEILHINLEKIPSIIPFVDSGKIDLHSPPERYRECAFRILREKNLLYVLEYGGAYYLFDLSEVIQQSHSILCRLHSYSAFCSLKDKKERLRRFVEYLNGYPCFLDIPSNLAIQPFYELRTKEVV